MAEPRANLSRPWENPDAPPGRSTGGVLGVLADYGYQPKASGTITEAVAWALKSERARLAALTAENEAMGRGRTGWPEVIELRRQVAVLTAALEKFADAMNWRDSSHAGQLFVDGDQTSGRRFACTALGHPRRKATEWCYCLCGDEYYRALDAARGATNG